MHAAVVLNEIDAEEGGRLPAGQHGARGDVEIVFQSWRVASERARCAASELDWRVKYPRRPRRAASTARKSTAHVFPHPVARCRAAAR